MATTINDTGITTPGTLTAGNVSTAGSLTALKGVGGTPAFSAYQSVSQSIAATTTTKVNLQSKEFDTTNAFDSTTNYRFQPNVAGYYSINGGVQYNGAGVNIAMIAKNGTEVKRGSQAV